MLWEERGVGRNTRNGPRGRPNFPAIKGGFKWSRLTQTFRKLCGPRPPDCDTAVAPATKGGKGGVAVFRRPPCGGPGPLPGEGRSAPRCSPWVRPRRRQVTWRKPGLRRALHTHGTAPFAALGARRQCGGTRAGSRGVPGPGGGVRSQARGSPGGLLNPRGATCLRRSDRVPFPCDGAPLPKKLWREGRESLPCDE